MRGQQGNVFTALAQCGQMNLHGVDAEEQVFAEVAGGCFLVQLRVGGGEHADIHAPGLRGADALQFAGFENAQELGLLTDGDVGDFIEKEGAVVGQFEAADAIGAGDKVAAVAFPEAAGAVNTYPIAVLKGSKNPELARKFVDLVTGESGQKVLNAAGFAKP